MEKEESLNESIKKITKKFLDLSAEKEVLVVSHFDTDGITSAAIMIQTLKKLDRRFTAKIVKSLSEEFIFGLPKDKLVLFLDLASGSLGHIEKAGLKEVFIIDHHELITDIPNNIEMVNPHLNGNERISSAGLVYLFCKQMDQSTTEFAKLAVLGMIGDLMENEIEGNLGNILAESEITKRQGLMIYPATRPLNRALEYCSQPYIPGVTGNSEGAKELLREAGIEPIGRRGYKNLIELTEDEMKRLVTGIMLRNPKANKEIIGDIFLIKFFNKMEDARELSARVNACSRLGQSDVALKFCMEIPEAKKQAEDIHMKYKQHIISGLEFAENADKIEGKGFVLINAKREIRDTVIGTIASILSNSLVYDEGTVIIAMAHYDDKVKVSARSVGRSGRNVRQVLDPIVKKIGGEVGGHEFAAGCNIAQENESQFIDLVKKNFEVELVKI